VRHLALVLAATALSLTACRAEETVATEQANAAQVAAAIEAAMTDSAAGWNAGDMDRFLAVYSADPQTSFVGSGGLVRGRAAMEERYREAYDWSQPDPAERGVLTFETEEVRPLGPDHALFIGRYMLTYPDGRDPATGYTSLVFAREGGSWRIIADHSS
jgi:uncharacterized protein (TIGR02246 family)